MKLLYLLLLAVALPAATFAQDVYQVKFIAGTTQYRAALVLWSNNTGKMRVRYYANGQTRMVEETVVVENTRIGLRVTCYDPVYPGTKDRYPSYKADNFYLSTDEQGRVAVTNIDDNGVVADCTVRYIKGAAAQQSFLGDFSWRLD